jgi:hypothetical protein
VAIWKGAHPGNFAAGRAGRRPEAIVIHIMDGSLDGTDSWFNDPASRVSAHYGVGKNGEVHQYVKEGDSAFHAGTIVRPTWPGLKVEGGKPVNPNLYTIGIEHEGLGLSASAWPPAQRSASLSLVADIARRWSIPIDDRHVIGHHAIRASKPDCPGRGIDLAGYIADLAGQPAAARAPERALELAVRIIRTTNVRRQPGTQNPPPRMLLAGDVFQAIAVAEGEPVNQNASWLRNAAGDYIWAGNTDHPTPF